MTGNNYNNMQLTGSVNARNKEKIFVVKNEYVSAPEKLFFVATLLAMVWQFFTIVNSLSIFQNGLVSFAVLAMWVFTCIVFLLYKNKFQKMLLTLSPSLLLFVIIAIKFIISGADIDTEGFFVPFKPLYITYTMCYGFVFAFSVNLLSRKMKVKLLKIMLFILTITPLPSYYYVFQNGDAIRDAVDKWGIIDFSYIYALIPFLGMLLISIKYGNKKYIKTWQLWCCMITNAGIILLANYATAFLMAAGTLFLALIFTRKTTIKKLCLFLIILLFMVVVLRNQISELINAVAKIDAFSTIMKKRLQDVARFLSGEGGGSSFGNRFLLMGQSLEAFAEFPIFGIPLKLVTGGRIGFHETWITLLGYSGIVGLILTLCGFILIYRCIFRNNKNNVFKQAFLVITLADIALSFLNPLITKTHIMMLLGVIPLFGVMFPAKEKIKEKVVSDDKNS